MSKLKELNYIFIKYVDNRRRIYLNLVKLKTIVSSEVAGNGYEEVEESFYHKRNNIKKIYNKGFIKQGIIPYWMEHPEAIKDDPATEEEIAEMNELLKEFKN